MISWWTPQLTGYELPLIKEVLDSNFLNDGIYCEKFEEKICELLNVKYAVTVTNGTSALFLALSALDIGRDDEVIVPDVTFIASANAVSMTGAHPILVDVDPVSLTIDPKSIIRAISPNTKAILPVHVSGRSSDMESIVDIANDYDLKIVEDAAEALMSFKDKKYLGTHGNLGCFSFSPNKTINTGQGGMIVTDDDELHSRLRELKDQGRPVRGTGGDDIHNSIGYNFKFTNLQAAVGLGQLSELSQRISRQKIIFQQYNDELIGLSGIRLPGFDIKGGEVPQWTDAIVDNRDELYDYLLSKGIQCRKFWHPIHTQKPYHQTDDLFPNSSHLMPKAVWLPSSFSLTDEDVLTVCDNITSFLSS